MQRVVVGVGAVPEPVAVGEVPEVVGEPELGEPRIAGVASPAHFAPIAYGDGLQPGSAESGPEMFSSTTDGILQLAAVVRFSVAKKGGHSALRKLSGRWIRIGHSNTRSRLPNMLPVHCATAASSVGWSQPFTKSA
jgi:hypothetical protein